MTIELALTNGTTTIALNALAGDVRVLAEWEPRTAGQNTTGAERAGDGNALGLVTYQDVVESVPLLLMGTASAIAGTVAEIQGLLERTQASPFATLGQRVFLTVRYAHDGAAWRSEVLAGRLVLSDAANQLSRGKMEATLIVTRRWFWEDTVERAIALRSAVTTTATTDWCTVYSESDTPNNRGWFEAAATEVTGGLPAPVKVQVRNNHGSNRSVVGLYLANYVHFVSQSADVIVTPSGSANSETGASQFVTAGAEPSRTWRLPLPASLLSAAGRLPVRPVVVFNAEPTAASLLRARLQWVEDGIGADTAVGEQQRVATQTAVDCGALMLLPMGIPASPPPMSLNLTLQVSSSQTVSLNWVVMMPASRGTYRRLRSLTEYYQIFPLAVLVDDGIEGLTYVQEDGGKTYPGHRGYHDYLHVWPGRTQRFRLHAQWSWDMVAQGGSQFQVRMSYRPRRLTL